MNATDGSRPSEQIVPLQIAMIDVLRDPTLDEAARRIVTARLLDLARATSFPVLAARALEHVLVMEIEKTVADDPGFGDPVNARLHHLLRAARTPATVAFARCRMVGHSNGGGSRLGPAGGSTSPKVVP